MRALLDNQSCCTHGVARQIGMQIEISDRWTALPGLAWGMPQPCLMGRVSIAQVTDAQFTLADRFMGQLLGEEVRSAPPVDADPTGGLGVVADRALLDRLPLWIGALQRHFRIPVSLRGVVIPEQASARGPVRAMLALACSNRQASLTALHAVVGWLRQIGQGQGPDVSSLEARLTILDELRERLSAFGDQRLNPFAFVVAAAELDVPVRRLEGATLLLGTGRKARWIDSSITDRTSSLGVRIAHDKMRTATVLRQAGLPAPVHERAATEQAAVEVAQRLGWPVVVKPADKEQGIGVAADLRDSDSVAIAWRAAAQVSSRVLVEKWADGFTHRLTIIEGRLVRVTKRIAGGVVGDGHSSIEQLVRALQLREDYQLRMRRAGRVLVQLDDEALGLLRQQGRARTDVPAPAEYVRLRRRDNVNAGGTNESCPLDTVHPHNRRLAQDAAAALRLDFAGIDLIIGDIRRSWQETGALICEVNAQPQIVAPGQPTFYQDIVRGMFPRGARVPARLVVCADDAPGRQAAAQRWMPDRPGHGLSTVDGLWLAEGRVSLRFPDALQAGLALLTRVDLVRATCLMSVPEILRLGLPLNRWDEVLFSKEVASDIHRQPAVERALTLMLATRPVDEA